MTNNIPNFYMLNFFQLYSNMDINLGWKKTLKPINQGSKYWGRNIIAAKIGPNNYILKHCDRFGSKLKLDVVYWYRMQTNKPSTWSTLGIFGNSYDQLHLV